MKQIIMICYQRSKTSKNSFWISKERMRRAPRSLQFDLLMISNLWNKIIVSANDDVKEVQWPTMFFWSFIWNQSMHAKVHQGDSLDLTIVRKKHIQGKRSKVMSFWQALRAVTGLPTSSLAEGLAFQLKTFESLVMSKCMQQIFKI